MIKKGLCRKLPINDEKNIVDEKQKPVHSSAFMSDSINYKKDIYIDDVTIG